MVSIQLNYIKIMKGDLIMQTLSNREFDVINLLIEGKTNSEIGKELFISTHTVKSVLEKIYEKFSIHNRVQLAIYYVLKIKPEEGKKLNN
jgi:DNA-binding NarL/FixJ family response regulator